MNLQSSGPSDWVRVIVVHHSASPAHQTTVADIDEWHRDRGFSGIGYHYVVQLDGLHWAVAHGRSEAKHGAHALGGYNSTTLGVCLAGNFSEHPVPPAQWAALMDLLCALLGRYSHLSSDDVLMHYETQPDGYTECPGTLFPRQQLRAELALRMRE